MPHIRKGKPKDRNMLQVVGLGNTRIQAIGFRKSSKMLPKTCRLQGREGIVVDKRTSHPSNIET